MGYHHFPCSIARYWRRGFEALGHKVQSVGYCTDGKISWRPDLDLSHWADIPTMRIEPFANIYQIDLPMHVIMQHGLDGEGPYDIFVNVDAGAYWKGPAPVPKIIIGTDPHAVGYDSQRQDCDLFVCMQNAYAQPGDVFIPYAYDDSWHFHQDVPVDHDVTFYGVEYAERTRDLNAMIAAGLRVERGTGLVFSEGSPRYSAGHLAYCRPSQWDLPARFFEAMAYGNIPLVTWEVEHWNSIRPLREPDLPLFKEFVPGWHYELFYPSTAGETLVDVAWRVLGGPYLEERKAACMEAVKPHTWKARAAQLLAICQERGLLKG